MILLLVLFFYLVGFGLLTYIKRIDLPLLATVGIAFGLGGSAVGLQLYMYSLFNISWDIGFIVLPWIVFLFSRAKRIGVLLKRQDMRTKVSNEDKALLVALVIIVLYLFLEASIYPLSSWDGIATWFMLAKGFFLHRGVTEEFYMYLQFDNPPLVSLQVSLSYLFVNKLDEQAALLLFPVYFTNLLFVFYAALRFSVKRNYALFFTILLATTQPLLRHGGKFDIGHVDLPLAYFFFVSGFLLFHYSKQQKVYLLFLSIIFASFSVLVKNDGISYFFFVVILGAFYGLKRAPRAYSIATITAMAIVLQWLSFRIIHLPSSYLAEGLFVVERIVPVLLASLKELFNIVRWHLLWIGFFLLFFFDDRKRQYLVITMLIFGQLVVYFAIFLITPLDPLEHIRGSYDRLLLHLSPLALLYVALVSYTILVKNASATK